MDRDKLAKAIFDWLNGPENDQERWQPPCSFNQEPDLLRIDVDGGIDCLAMADGILRMLGSDDRVAVSVSDSAAVDLNDSASASHSTTMRASE